LPPEEPAPLADSNAVTDAYRESIESSHAARVARLRSATGWLSLVGKIFLDRSSPNEIVLPDQTRAGEIRFEEGEDGEDGDRAPIFTPANGDPPRRLKSDREGKADALTINGFVLEVMERGDTFALRIRDTRILPRPYGGIDSYPIDPSWRVHARLEKYANGPREVEIDFEGATGAVADSFVSPGVVVFEKSGAEHRIQAVYEDSSQRRLFLLFRDQTSGPESYGSGRFVYADLPDIESGNLLFIDFNLAMIPGCAFTHFATCPIPPKENRIALPVRAGEKNYLGKPNGS
jgi:uncharacterized protein